MSDTAIFERPGGSSPAPWRNQQPGRRDGSGPCPPTAHARSLLPAIRIPVTPQNRQALRSLRAQEMEHWQKAADPRRERDSETSYLSPPPPDREAAVIFLLLGATAAALLLQTTAAATLLVAHWDRVEGLIEALTR